MNVPRVVVAGPASGHGKTTVATGLLAAYRARGMRVAGFKVGPDYIDPSYHALASGASGRNLDPVLVGSARIGPLFAHGAVGADLAIIEGAMGLYDGRAGQGDHGSTGEVAALLDAPVVLVVDASGMGRSIAALVHGFRSFATAGVAVRLAGVVLNRVASTRHEEILRDALDEVGTPVLGALHRHEAVATPSRHLGLVPAAERSAEARAAVDVLAGLISSSVDLAAVEAVARSAPDLSVTPWAPPAVDPVPGRPVVAIAGGPAFTFGYAETPELLAAAGAEVVTFDPLRDTALPAGTRAIVVGGGFPEVYAAELSANAPLRAAVAAHATAGRPIAAECAGLLWLCRSLDGAPMCKVLDADATMTGRLTLGYRDAVAVTDTWLGPVGTRVTGHEFHRTSVVPRKPAVSGSTPPAAVAQPAWQWRDAAPEGFVTGRVHASYLHLHWAGYPQIARRLVEESMREQASGGRASDGQALDGRASGGRASGGQSA